MLKKFLNLFKQNYSKANNPVADKTKTTEDDDTDDAVKYEAKVLSKKNKHISCAQDAKADKKVNDNNYYEHSKRMNAYNKLLSIDEIERLHSYYFNTALSKRVSNIVSIKRKMKANEAHEIDLAVYDYIIGWATIDKICDKYELNSRKLYEYIHLIKDIVNAKAKDKHV